MTTVATEKGRVMSRYIDAEWLKGEIRKAFPSFYMRVEINTLVNLAPSIDIVRCSECKWRKADNSCDLNCRIEYLDGTETDMWFYVKPDDFCSYGEREEEDIPMEYFENGGI